MNNKGLTRKQMAVRELNKIGIFTLDDIDKQADFDNRCMSRFDWMFSKVGEYAVWIMNDVALGEFIQGKK